MGPRGDDFDDFEEGEDADDFGAFGEGAEADEPRVEDTDEQAPLSMTLSSKVSCHLEIRNTKILLRAPKIPFCKDCRRALILPICLSRSL